MESKLRKIESAPKFGELPFVEDPTDIIIESKSFMPSLAHFGFDRTDVPSKEDW